MVVLLLFDWYITTFVITASAGIPVKLNEVPQALTLPVPLPEALIVGQDFVLDAVVPIGAIAYAESSSATAF